MGCVVDFERVREAGCGSKNVGRVKFMKPDLPVSLAVSLNANMGIAIAAAANKNMGCKKERLLMVHFSF